MSPSQDKLRTRATGIGALAVLLWSLLAPLTVAAAGVPPLQLLATSFALACAFGFVWLAATGRWQRLRQPLAFWLFATAALFGYHLLYFVALSLAPPAQANLVNYLWPLLIVLLSAFGTGQRLRARHVAGAVLALGGTVLLLLSRDDVQMAAPNRTAGLLAALGCAIVWSTYSVSNHRFRQVPSEAMFGVCGFVALLGAVSHFLAGEETVHPATSQWLAMAGLGLGPVGLAFLAWDFGTKHGKLALLGTLAYAAPVLSTLLLVALGHAPATVELFAACLLVVGGAWVAATAREAPEKHAGESVTGIDEKGTRT
jgi:drug/metabolite transporter (DMT)-like permease